MQKKYLLIGLGITSGVGLVTGATGLLFGFLKGRKNGLDETAVLAAEKAENELKKAKIENDTALLNANLAELEAKERAEREAREEALNEIRNKVAGDVKAKADEIILYIYSIEDFTTDQRVALIDEIKAQVNKIYTATTEDEIIIAVENLTEIINCSASDDVGAIVRYAAVLLSKKNEEKRELEKNVVLNEAREQREHEEVMLQIQKDHELEVEKLKLEHEEKLAKENREVNEKALTTMQNIRKHDNNTLVETLAIAGTTANKIVKSISKARGN